MMALLPGQLSIFLLIIPCTWSTYIENVAANVNNRGEKRHERFVPLVAFECGFRNKYMGEDGAWISDVNRWATCQSGKLDILKYCRKTYPKLDITNIVEYSHEMKISNWCHEEGTPCKWTHTVRPYQCVVGEFHSEALQVPHGCRFGHVNDRQSCSDYNHWKDVARKQCQSKMSDKKKMIVRSLAVLEPCGLDLFTGVEFVCCPDNKKSNDAVEKAVGLVDQNKDEDDDDDDDDYDDDYSDEDDDEERNNGGHFEPYLKAADSISEHERFKAAEQRLNRKHRVKVNKVMREWSELVARYKKMNETDPKGAEVFMREMTARYRKTIASLEEEKKENKKELEVEHEEAVQSRLNDKKRQATHDYRAALAVQVGAANKHNVLKALKTYIRMEEKDRTHMLNRYRHLLRTDQVAT
ncbi:hypothetical protein AB6A40_010498 [Gnathostoma spinigerum]|uniref:Beta-amyloid-like protein n=1 Tax=Gnathostoma spinigerum TaxID=75299 RepID=A0ABD6EUZ5_9BILA